MVQVKKIVHQHGRADLDTRWVATAALALRDLISNYTQNQNFDFDEEKTELCSEKHKI